MLPESKILSESKAFSATFLLGAALFAFTFGNIIGAHARIYILSITPIPFTLQTFFVFLAGLLLGRKRAMIPQFAYVFLGVAGLPVFAGAGAGLAYLAGPTGGYLFGFIAGAYVTGLVSEIRLKNRFFTCFLASIAGIAAIYLCGITHLGVYAAITGRPLSWAIFVGTVPFIVGDLIKACAASAIAAPILAKVR